MLGSLSGEQKHRSDTTYRYQQSAKESAGRECIGTDPARVFECVVEKVETSNASAQGEQDLAAQQEAAWAGMLGSVWSLGALIATILGLIWIKGTLDATRIGAEAAQGAVDETKRIGEAQTRAYLSAVRAEFHVDRKPRDTPNFPSFETIIYLNNSGQTPAVNVSYYCTSCVVDWKDSNILPKINYAKNHSFINNATPNSMLEVKVTCFGLAVHWNEFKKRWRTVTDDTPFGKFPILVIYGVIFYEDVFGKTYRSRFGFSLEGVDPGRNPISRDDLPTIQARIPTFEPVVSRLDLIEAGS